MASKPSLRLLAVFGFLILLTGTVSHTTSCAGEKFGGLGIRVAQLYDPEAPGHKGSLVVLLVMEDFPAEAAGIKRGDIITHIDGQLARGQDFDFLVAQKMRGPAGSQAQLMIERFTPHGTQTLKISVERTGMSGG